MDIPKQPIKTDLYAPEKPPITSGRNIVTDINDLSMKPGQQYFATVEGKPTKPNETPALTKTLADNEWLVSVKGQLVLIKSDKPLEAGQKLLLALIQHPDSKQLSLSAQLLNKPQINAELNPTPSAGLSTKLPAVQIPVLLQALTATLDKQVLLDEGFKQLTQFIQQSANFPKDAPIAQTIQKAIFDLLPQRVDLAPTSNTQANQNQPLNYNLIKQSLQNSGLFLEPKLTQESQIREIAQRINQLSEGLIKLTNTQTTDTLSGLTSSEKTLSSKASFLQNYSPAIQKIQQTIEQILKLSTSSESPTRQNTLQQDLKANLLITLGALNKQLSTQTPPTDGEQILSGRIDNLSGLSPFSFPLLPPTKTSSKAAFERTDNATGQVLRLLAGMLTKIQFNQLHSLLQSNQNTEGPVQQTWFFELPVVQSGQQINVFNMRIDKENDEEVQSHESSSDKSCVWKLLLSFDLENLGPIYVLIKLRENTISSELWADQANTVALLNLEKQHFKTQLEKLGLEVGDVNCKQGQPSHKKAKLDRHLVDTKV